MSARRRAGWAFIRGAGSTIKLNRRTGQFFHQPPKLAFEAGDLPRTPAAFTVTDSICAIDSAGLSAAWKRGDLRSASETVKAPWRRLMELEQQEEEQLLELEREAEFDRLLRRVGFA